MVSSVCSSNEIIDELLKDGIKSGNIPGVVAVAANSDGIIYQEAVGKSNIAKDINITTESLFHIASMTKPITTVAVLQLVEQGKVNLDGAAADYLPHLVNVMVLEGYDKDGQPILKKPRTVMTVRNLLNHTSGYVYGVWHKHISTYLLENNISNSNQSGNGFLTVPLAFDPGAKWEYGIGLDWAGVLIETVSGQSLEEYFKQHILEPLQMNNTQFQLTKEQQSRLVIHYARSENGELIEAQTHSTLPFFSGGGGLMSTPADYIRFLRAILGGGVLEGKRILSERMIDEMAENQIGDLDIDYLMPGHDPEFGLGFLINSKPIKARRAAGSLTWWGVYNTNFWIDRDNDICGVLFTQMSPDGDTAVNLLYKNFEKSVYRMASDLEKPSNH